MSDLRNIVRSLGRAPGPSLLAALTLGLGVGATTTVFSIASALFLRPLPHVDFERTVSLRAFDSDGPASWSIPNLEDAAAYAAPLRLAGFMDMVISLRADGDAISTVGLVVTPDYFDVLGVRPERGRFFGPAEAIPGSGVVVIGYDAWHRHFAADPDAVGRTVHLNGHAATVIGIAPPGFVGTFTGFAFDVWAPTGMLAAIAPGVDPNNRRQGAMEVIARLPPGMALPAANAALQIAARRLEEASPAENVAFRIQAHRLTGFDDDIRTGALGLTALLLAIAVLVLAIACANVACVLLARGVARHRELTIRMAVGADRGRLARMLFSETAVIAAAGGMVGILSAAWLIDLVRLLQPPLPVRISLDVSLNAGVFLFALGVTAVTALVCGLVPALRATGSSADLLRSSAPPSVDASRFWRTSVIVQITASILLIGTAGLFVRTLVRANDQPLGFETDGVTVRPLIDLGLVRGQAGLASTAHALLLADIEAAPGIARAALTRTVPLGLGTSSMSVRIDDRAAVLDGTEPELRFTAVTHGYFETMRTPIVAGREFLPTDRHNTQPVAIVSAAFARRFWPDLDPIGRRITREGRSFEVVGVAGDVRLERRETSAPPYLYLLFDQWPGARANLIVRESQVGASHDALRAAIRSLAPDLPAVDPVPLRDFIALSLLPQRVAAMAAGVLGLIGALLAALGVYGLVSFSVARRTREIGIRMALGAGATAIVRTVLVQSLRLAAIGTLLGLSLTFVASTVLGAVLHGIDGTDPITFLLAGTFALIITALGGAVPVRRALRVSPSRAMRVD